MNKVMRVGNVSPYGGRPVGLFIEAEYKDGRLSLTGVIGPKSNGDAVGGCGQISMEFAHRNPEDNDDRYDKPLTPEQIEFAPGWDRERWLDLLDVWHRWHLNDISPMCEHQREQGWGKLSEQKATLYFFRLTESTRKRQDAVKKASLHAAERGETFEPKPADVKYLLLPYEVKWHRAELPEGVAAHYEPRTSLYKGDSHGATEVKALGWLYPEEHPDGLLCRACSVCGYKYGSAWRKEDVPADVIKFIEALPDADLTPAWV
jgi:hypothetical protein